MKAYKGFNKDMTCRGFQFKEGETYTENEAELCKSGFHACESPLDTFAYYAPAESVYHEVELDDVCEERSSDTKRCGKRIKIGAALSIKNLVDAHVEYVKEYAVANAKHNTGYRSAASNTGFCSAASNTGSYSVASNTGSCSVASNTGSCSVASNAGDRSAASNTGDRSAASNTGFCSAASNAGDYSAASNTGSYSAASNTGSCSVASNTGSCSVASNAGDYSAASNTGDCSAAEVSGKNSVAMAIGGGSRARGSLGCWIVLAEWNDDGIKNVRCAFVDGVTLKPDVWYKLENGEFVEVSE